MATVNINPPVLSDKDVQRFNDKVDKTPGFGPNGDCWHWTSAISKTGYGAFEICSQGRCRALLAHRVAYFLSSGNWAALFVLHSCDNRSCCNPAHLREGTCADNVNDKVARGRCAAGERNGRYTKPESTPRGEQVHNSVLTDNLVHQIRALRKTGMTQKAIAITLQLTLGSVKHLLQGKTWKHI